VLNVARDEPNKAKGILEFIDEKRERNLEEKGDDKEK